MLGSLLSLTPPPGVLTFRHRIGPGRRSIDRLHRTIQRTKARNLALIRYFRGARRAALWWRVGL